MKTIFFLCIFLIQFNDFVMAQKIQFDFGKDWRPFLDTFWYPESKNLDFLRGKEFYNNNGIKTNGLDSYYKIHYQFDNKNRAILLRFKINKFFKLASQIFINDNPGLDYGAVNVNCKINGPYKVVYFILGNSRAVLHAKENIWYTILINQSGLIADYFVNGKFKKRVFTNNVTSLNGEFGAYFGIGRDGEAYPFDGYFDEFQFYERPLNKKEITELFKKFGYKYKNEKKRPYYLNRNHFQVFIYKGRLVFRLVDDQNKEWYNYSYRIEKKNYLIRRLNANILCLFFPNKKIKFNELIYINKFGWFKKEIII